MKNTAERKKKMTRSEAIKKVWNLVSNQDVDNLREAEKIANEYDIFMEFDEDYIAVEDDIFYLNR